MNGTRGTLRFAFALAAAGILTALAIRGAVAAGGGSAGGAVQDMIRSIVEAPEVVTNLVIERSDPFGGPPDREKGQVWFIPGRGLRYRSSRPGGQDVVIDRETGAFLVYNPTEKTVYRAAFDRAPARLRRLIEDPHHALSVDLRAVAESRAVHGTSRAGYRLRTVAIGDSMPEVTTWIAPSAPGGLPRWIAFASDADSVLLQLDGLVLRKSAKASDLKLSAPTGTKEQPLDPRELLEPRHTGESR